MRYFSGDVANSSGNLEEFYAHRAAYFLLWTSYEQRTQIQGPLPKHTLCHACNSFNSTSYAQYILYIYIQAVLEKLFSRELVRTGYFSRISTQRYEEFYDGLKELDSVHVSCTDF